MVKKACSEWVTGQPFWHWEQVSYLKNSPCRKVHSGVTKCSFSNTSGHANLMSNEFNGYNLVVSFRFEMQFSIKR